MRFLCTKVDPPIELRTTIQAKCDAGVERCRQVPRAALPFFAALSLVVGPLFTPAARAQTKPQTQSTPSPRPPPAPQAQAPTKPQAKPAPTKQLLLDLASEKQPLADLIDPAVGLLFMDHFQGPGEDGNTIEDLHVCPRDLAAFAKGRWSSVASTIRQAKEADHLTCAATPLPICQAGGAGEWDPVTHFMFGTRGTGSGTRLVLRAIAIDDEVLVSSERVASEHAGQAKLLAHVANCP